MPSPISNLAVPGGGQALQFQRFSPEQLQAMEQLRSLGMSGLGALQGLSFDPIEQRARQQFSKTTIPSLAERFTAMGGGQRSSAFQSALGEQASDLESQLAALRSQYGLQQHQALLPLLQLGLQPSFETVYSPPGPGFGASFAGPLAQGVGASLPLLLGGIGGPIGSGIGSLLSYLLGGKR